MILATALTAAGVGHLLRPRDTAETDGARTTAYPASAAVPETDMGPGETAPEKSIEELVNGPTEEFVASAEKLTCWQSAMLTAKLGQIAFKGTPSPADLEALLDGKPDEMRASSHEIAAIILTHRMKMVAAALRKKIAAMQADNKDGNMSRAAVLSALSGMVPDEHNQIFDDQHGRPQRIVTFTTIHTFLKNQAAKRLFPQERIDEIHAINEARRSEPALAKADLTVQN